MARVALAATAFGVVVDNTNQFVSGASVSLKTTGTNTPIPIYQDATTSTTLTQPLTTDSDGRIPGFADGQQTVDIAVTVGGETFPTVTGQLVRGDQTPSLDSMSGRLVLTQLPSHASTHASGGSDPVTPASIGAATTSQAAAALQIANNLSDVSSVSSSRTNLGLGTAATHPATDFPLAANNLSDLPDSDSSRANIRIPILLAAQAVATTNVSSLSGLSTIDSYALQDGDRVLLTGQTTGSQNGPWVAHSGSWVRPNDYPSGGSLKSRLIAVNGGATNPGTVWVMTSTASITIDTTATSWAKIGGGGPAAAVTSVFGRTGAITATHGDYTYVFRTVHTFAIRGGIAVPTGGGADLTNYIPPFFVSLGANETAKIVKCLYVIGTGTSVTCDLQKNGSGVTGFTGISVTSTAGNTTATGVSVAEGDYLAPVVTAVSGSPGNLSFTVVLERTVT